jgi:hypothetical protein
LGENDSTSKGTQMPSIFRIRSFSIALLIVAGYAQAQVSTRVRMAPPSRPTASPTPAASGPTPSNLTVTYLTSKEIDLSWTENDTTIKDYQIERCKNQQCTTSDKTFTSKTTSYSDSTVEPRTDYYYHVKAMGAADYSETIGVTTPKFTCVVLPTRPGCMEFGTGKADNINAYFQTNGPLSFFNQIKSIYNGASGSATVSADLTTLNFANGGQVTATTNVQAGSTGATNVSSGTVPTLSANGAGQATQNMLYGGTVLASELYPFLAAGGSKLGSPGGLGFEVNLIAKEGVDIQNFKSGTNVNVSSPPFHGSAQIEGYLQYNSINLSPKSASGSQGFAGAVFAGGSYGYDYMSHGYARDYGFGSKVSNGIGQVVVGILINGVANISVSRAFGPSQTYIDSATMSKTTVNNFKAWSFGIAYQSAAPASKP